MTGLESHSGEMPITHPATLLAQILQKVQTGLLILDERERIVLLNDWFAVAANLPEREAIGKTLAELFPDLQGSRLQGAAQTALRQGFPALLSQVLNRAPFPLFASEEDRQAGTRMDQHIQVIPLGIGEATQHYCIIQIVNVSAAVKRESVLHEQALQLKRSLMIDGLTTVFSRRYWEEQVEIEFRKARRTGLPVAMIMLDIDFFKRYNDSYGHQNGDLCLARVARGAARGLLRLGDFLARYGGEEFVAVLPETDLESAAKVAERMRSLVENLQIPHDKSDTAPYVTVSLGVSCRVPGEGDTHQALLEEADAALYQAKSMGRNQVVMRTDRGFVPVERIPQPRIDRRVPMA